MDKEEKIALKAACIQAAAILIAPAHTTLQRGAQVQPDTANCARYARDLFGKLTGESWD